MSRKGIYYNRTNTCENIKEDGTICDEKLSPHHANREYDKEGNWTGRWLCNSCYGRKYIKSPDSNNSMLKSVAHSRTGNLDPNSPEGKGRMFEELTCIWRGVKNLNKENDNYNSPIDHSRDSELGIIQTKGSFIGLNKGRECWNFGITGEFKKEFDYMICYCVDYYGNIIERVYIFPKEEIINRSSITIYKIPLRISKTLYWYEKYRIKDENITKNVNDIFQKIKRKKMSMIFSKR